MSNFSKQTVKSPKVFWPLHFRPALRAGVKCGDTTALSCFKIEPSALPLPWTFCRSPTRQNRVLSESENAIGRLGNLPSLPMIPYALFLIFQRQNCSPRQWRTNAPTPRSTFSEVYGCYPAHRVGTKCLTGADTGALL